MSEYINDPVKRKETLKDLIRKLHDGDDPGKVREQLTVLLGQIPYDEVVQVEQELMVEGLPREEVIKLCDIHGAVLDGKIDLTKEKVAPEGHPVHTFKQENLELNKVVERLEKIYEKLNSLSSEKNAQSILDGIGSGINSLLDVDMHYRRKENLLFPFLEKHDITGPPQVMWAKHDETRALLKEAQEVLSGMKTKKLSEIQSTVSSKVKTASDSIVEMITKEEQILFPMCMDTLNDEEWYQVYSQGDEIGYSLYKPSAAWKPADLDVATVESDKTEQRLQFPTGSLSMEELSSIMNTIPVDMTFVDKDDTVRFFTRPGKRIFDRNKSIIGRKVQMCHPPKSIDTVQKIVDDFRSGKESRAAFWINLNEKFVHIEYFAIRNDNGEYLGTLEVSQDLTGKRKLEGEQRLVNYS